MALSDQMHRVLSRVGADHAPSPRSRIAVPLFQLLAAGDPAGGADLREVPAVLEERGGPAVRARDQPVP